MTVPLTALKILVIEDNDDLREATVGFLQGQGMVARGVPMAEDVNDDAGDFFPDIYVVDLNLPGEDGLTLARRLRRVHPRAGIVMVTARSQIGDKLKGYESGADLYLTKPIDPRELLASLQALALRIRPGPQDGTAMRMSLGRLCLRGPIGEVALTAGEASLLMALARAPQQSLERWQLMEIMGGGGQPVSDATLEMRVARLRKKMVSAGGVLPCIKSLHKVGYQLSCPVLLD